MIIFTYTGYESQPMEYTVPNRLCVIEKSLPQNPMNYFKDDLISQE